MDLIHQHILCGAADFVSRTESNGSCADSYFSNTSDASAVSRYVDSILTNEDGSARPIDNAHFRREIVVNIMTNFRTLQYNMASSKYIAEVMHSKRLISSTDLHDIVGKYSKEIFESTSKLLECVLDRRMKQLYGHQFQRIHCFLLQLKATNQRDLLLLILKPGAKLYRPHKDYIRIGYDFVSRNLIIDTWFLACLHSEGVLDDYEVEDISAKSEDHMKMYHLLYRTLCLKSLGIYEKFLKVCAENGQQHVTDYLNSLRLSSSRPDGRDSLRSSVTVENSASSQSRPDSQLSVINENVKTIRREQWQTRKSTTLRHRRQNVLVMAKDDVSSLQELMVLELAKPNTGEEKMDCGSTEVVNDVEPLRENTPRADDAETVRRWLIHGVSSEFNPSLLRPMYEKGNRDAVLIQY